MLDHFFLFLSGHKFLNLVRECKPVIISRFQDTDQLSSVTCLHFHFGAYSLNELLHYLERLIQACRSDSQGIIFRILVEDREKGIVYGHTVIHVHNTIFRLDSDGNIAIRADSYICNKTAAGSYRSLHFLEYRFFVHLSGLESAAINITA